jgi:hypothetical protein
MMDDLIKRLESAPGPDRQLDALVWVACYEPSFLDENVVIEEICRDGITGEAISSTAGVYWVDECKPPVAQFTENVADALLLKPDNFSWAAGDCNEDNRPWACLTSPEGTDYDATAATEPNAICIAILRARTP